MTFLILAVHSLVAWRITHFIILDTMFEGTRDRFVAWLTRPKVSSDGTYASAGPPLWRHKIWLLVTCPFCISVWAAAAVTWGHVWFVEELPFPVFWWLAVASGAMMVYAYVDSED